MEPERKIEKLLRAYAKHRRTKAGDAFKLHPATRRLLQGEVTRRKPESDEDETSLSLWDLFRTNWAVLSAFLLIIFFSASFLVPTWNKAKNKAKRIEAIGDLKQIGVAAQVAAVDNHGRLPITLDGLTNEIGSDLVFTDKVSNERFVYVAGGKTLDDLETNAVLAYSPGDENEHAILFADGSVKEVSGEEFTKLTNNLSAQPAMSFAATKQPLPATPSSGLVPSDILSSDSTINGAGTQISSMVFHGELTTNSLQAEMSPNPILLAQFKLQQNGSNISIVDQDGSIYRGTLQSSNATFTVMGKSNVTTTTVASAKNYFFRVSGTNLTLNQPIIFYGNLIAGTSPADTNTTFTPESTKNATTKSQRVDGLLTQPTNHFQIIGAVTLDTTNHFKITAIPALLK